MIAYHGSNHNFKNFKITHAMSSAASENNQGPGIYFSTDISVAKSYGCYLYTIDIDKDHLLDFRNEVQCRKCINNITSVIKSGTGVDIRNYCNTWLIARYIANGCITPAILTKEISLNLDASEKYYRQVSVQTMETIQHILDRYDKENLNIYLYKCEIPDIGIIRRKGLPYVKIIDKTKI